MLPLEFNVSVFPSFVLALIVLSSIFHLPIVPFVEVNYPPAVTENVLPNLISSVPR